MAIEFRLMTIDDYDEVYDIWVACHNGLNSTDDSKEGREKYLKRNPTTSFVAVDAGHVAGVILCNLADRDYIEKRIDISSYMIFAPVFPMYASGIVNTSP